MLISCCHLCVEQIALVGRTTKSGFHSFDAVFSYIVFRHMPDHKTVKTNIEENARVLESGGLAKIQRRGRPTERGKWFSGSSFTMPQVESMIERIPLQILKTEGSETRSFWVWFQKL